MFEVNVKLFSGEIEKTSYPERHYAKSHAGRKFNQKNTLSARVSDESGNTVLQLEKNSAGNCIARVEA